MTNAVHHASKGDCNNRPKGDSSDIFNLIHTMHEKEAESTERGIKDHPERWKMIGCPVSTH
ncbi:hypothetical protein PAENIP36_03470 [Paenibacillus sp. P36]